MSVKAEFVKVLPEHIEYIARNMRPEDAAEVMASHGHTPLQAMRFATGVSALMATALVNGQPAAIIGLCKGSLVTGEGCPWMLGTPVVMTCGRELIRRGRQAVEQMLSECRSLSNHVHVDNKGSISWLRRIGFQFDKPEPFGVRGEMFMRFWMERTNV